jgi:hypothetical protein
MTRLCQRKGTGSLGALRSNRVLKKPFVPFDKLRIGFATKSYGDENDRNEFQHDTVCATFTTTAAAAGGTR